MSSKKKIPDLWRNKVRFDAVKAFFMEAALTCLNEEGYSTLSGEQPNTTINRYERGDFLYVEVLTANGDHYASQTTVFYNWRPMLVVHRTSWVRDQDAEVINFVDSFHKACYHQGLWQEHNWPTTYELSAFPKFKYESWESEQTYKERVYRGGKVAYYSSSTFTTMSRMHY